jgi:hypothetical protein
MVGTRKQKRSAAADSRNPLQQADILQRVLDYVGPGHWCFVAEVCRVWKVLYKKVASRDQQVISLLPKTKTITCAPEMTLFSAVFATPLPVRNAQADRLCCTTTSYLYAAGAYADIVALKAAHKLGMQYTHEVMHGAARCNEPAVVQFLRTKGCPWNAAVFTAEQCPWSATAWEMAAINGHANTFLWLHEHGRSRDPASIYRAAAQGGNTAVMEFLQQQPGIKFTAFKLRMMLNVAGARNKLAAAQWLRQQGVEWPTVLRYGKQWSGDTLEWARAEGCTSPLK